MALITPDPSENRICFCHGVSEGQIREAILGQGATTVEDVQRLTKASTGCGGCTCEVERILTETALEKTG